MELLKKTADVIRAHCSEENYTHKISIEGYPATGETFEMALLQGQKIRPSSMKRLL